jgi:hypothetical protein
MKSDRLKWLKFINGNLKSLLKHFCKYVSKFRKKFADLIQLEFNGTSLPTPYEIAGDFSEHFQPVHSNHYTVSFPHFLVELSLVSISDSDVRNAINRFRPQTLLDWMIYRVL